MGFSTGWNMATALAKAPWGAANTKNGGGLAKLVSPRPDDRLLFAMYDHERALRDAANAEGDLDGNVQSLTNQVESLSAEVEGLAGQVKTLTASMEKLTAVIEELVSQRA